MMPQPFPTADPQQPDEDRRQYGARILARILADPTPAPIGPVLAGFTDDQLYEADRAAYRTVTARDIEPRAVDILAHVRRTIAQTQTIRAAIDAEAREHFAQQLAQPQQPQQPPPGIGGSRVPTPTPPPTTPPNDGHALTPPRTTPTAYRPAASRYVTQAEDLAF